MAVLFDRVTSLRLATPAISDVLLCRHPGEKCRLWQIQTASGWQAFPTILTRPVEKELARDHHHKQSWEDKMENATSTEERLEMQERLEKSTAAELIHYKGRKKEIW